MGLLDLPTDMWSKAAHAAGVAYQPVPTSPMSQYASSDASITPSNESDTFSLDDRNSDRDRGSSPERSSRERDRLRDSLEMEMMDAPHRPGAVRVFARRDPLALTSIAVALATSAALLVAFTFPTTIHVFVGLAAGITWWTVCSWARIIFYLVVATLRGSPRALALPRWSTGQCAAQFACTVLVLFWLSIGLTPPAEVVPSLLPSVERADTPSPTPRYFFAANLYNNEDILPRWSRELLLLIDHLGPENTFVSIYESNSDDSTPDLLAEFADDLSHLGVAHRILSDESERWWPYGTAPERIQFLAAARNKALEPLQSPDDSVRLADYDTFTKVVFLNDVVFTWQGVVRLLATSWDGDEGEDGYDLACAMDYYQAGFYDTWVARDVCGTPMRIAWPFVKDPVSKERLRNKQPFEVSACWNGIVAFPTGPYLYRPETSDVSDAPDEGTRLAKRGWKMVDNSTYPNSRMSPAVSLPLKFRSSGIEACDHSECFLFGYDLHRLYNTPERPPRILMNPTVEVAYRHNWFVWQNVVLRIPSIKIWVDHWSHGVPLEMIDWFWEWVARRRDYCTWAALSSHAPERCPALPGSVKRPWNA